MRNVGLVIAVTASCVPSDSNSNSKSGLPVANGTPAVCAEVSEPVDASVCTWAQQGVAVVIGRIETILPAVEPTKFQDESFGDATNCELLESSLELGIEREEILWGAAPQRIVVRFAPSTLANWLPFPDRSATTVTWISSDVGAPLTVGQTIGLSLFAVDGHPDVFSTGLMFAETNGNLQFQKTDAECETSPVILGTLAELRSSLSECEEIASEAISQSHIAASCFDINEDQGCTTDRDCTAGQLCESGACVD